MDQTTLGLPFHVYCYHFGAFKIFKRNVKEEEERNHRSWLFFENSRLESRAERHKLGKFGVIVRLEFKSINLELTRSVEKIFSLRNGCELVSQK